MAKFLIEEKQKREKEPPLLLPLVYHINAVL